MTSARSVTTLASSAFVLGIAAAPAHAEGTFTIGAGFDTDHGFIASAGIEQDDLFHTGQRLALFAKLSARLQEFVLEYDVPDLLGSGLDLELDLWNRRRSYETFAREGAGGSVTVGKDLGGSTRAYLRYGIEEVSIDPLDPLARERSSRVPGDGRVATLGAGIVYDTLDEKLWPHHGTRLELYGETAERALGSEHEFVRLRASIDHARPLGPFTLRAHGAAGYIRGRDGHVPLSERFQHDGWGDLRGYRLGSIPDGGGDLEALGHLELELPISKKLGISVAAFADAGIMYNADPAYGPIGGVLRRSVGFSILWRSPIGPLRFDWAMPLDGEDAEKGFLFGFGMPF